MAIEKFDIYKGKYTVVLEDGYKIKALRYGGEWREEEFIGDGFILALIQEILDLREKTEKYEHLLRNIIKEV